MNRFYITNSVLYYFHDTYYGDIVALILSSATILIVTTVLIIIPPSLHPYYFSSFHLLPLFYHFFILSFIPIFVLFIVLSQGISTSPYRNIQIIGLRICWALAISCTYLRNRDTFRAVLQWLYISISVVLCPSLHFPLFLSFFFFFFSSSYLSLHIFLFTIWFNWKMPRRMMNCWTTDVLH